MKLNIEIACHKGWDMLGDINVNSSEFKVLSLEETEVKE